MRIVLRCYTGISSIVTMRAPRTTISKNTAWAALSFRFQYPNWSTKIYLGNCTPKDGAQFQNGRGSGKCTLSHKRPNAA